MRRLGQIFLVLFCAAAQFQFSNELRAQNIFDDEPTAETEKAKPAPAKAKAAESDDETKPVTKKKKRKGKKKKAKAAAAAGSEAPAKAEISEYTPEEIARQSFVWAPETSTVNLVSEAPGIKPETKPVQPKPASLAAAADLPEPRPQGQTFKLPEIPLTQVLIVAGFVILFLIYRFRVGRQIKRKKY
ncbi:hypothetical protein [Turneriella parva]|uniref:Uncharacterized protein n=1 Tax=Turneriella parva (strain ATCC BAA-1111 / DSM 21527 / NCTC 11395 / H) TaxID=869212 RepID=I4BAW5_TURPD|nr:hypothetical protein [Turneriella parva]AFM14422.1 hypothetical protein Turpa_3788 [Turneriella parva DSM 21527]